MLTWDTGVNVTFTLKRLIGRHLKFYICQMSAGKVGYRSGDEVVLLFIKKHHNFSVYSSCCRCKKNLKMEYLYVIFVQAVHLTKLQFS